LKLKGENKDTTKVRRKSPQYVYVRMTKIRIRGYPWIKSITDTEQIP